MRDRGKRKTKSRRSYKVLDSFNQHLKESRGGKKGFGVGGEGGGVDSLRRATEKRKERRKKKNRSEKRKKRKSRLSKR